VNRTHWSKIGVGILAVQCVVVERFFGVTGNHCATLRDEELKVEDHIEQKEA
jgi:hypothetical protein